MSPAARYAESTSVPVGRTRDEIEKTLARYGATAFGYATTAQRAMVEFTTATRRVRFFLPVPGPDERRFTHTPTGRPRTAAAARVEHDKAERQTWRALLLLVKAKLEAVASGIVTFETEFLPHTVLPSGRTVLEEIGPQVDQAYLTGRVAPLQIGSA